MTKAASRSASRATPHRRNAYSFKPPSLISKTKKSFKSPPSETSRSKRKCQRNWISSRSSLRGPRIRCRLWVHLICPACMVITRAQWAPLQKSVIMPSKNHPIDISQRWSYTRANPVKHKGSLRKSRPVTLSLRLGSNSHRTAGELPLKFRTCSRQVGRKSSQSSLNYASKSIATL